MEEVFWEQYGTRRLSWDNLSSPHGVNLWGVPFVLVVKFLTHNPGVQGLSFTGSSRFFFVGVSMGKTFQNISLVLVKLRKDINNVNCCRDMTEMLLKVVQNTIQSKQSNLNLDLRSTQMKPSYGTFTNWVEQVCEMILKSIHQYRSYGPEPHTHIHQSDVVATVMRASGLDKTWKIVVCKCF